MRNDAAVLLRNPRKKSRHVFKRNQRDIEAITEANEPRAFNRGSNIQDPGEIRWLVRHNAYGPAAQSRKSNTDVLGKHLLHFEEVSVVYNEVDYFADIVGLI